MAKPVFGLIGGIASGKSTAADMLRTLGVEAIDADELAHEELDREDIIDTLSRWWPSVVTGGKVDRKALAEVVFADQRSLGRLEGILWPGVHAGIKECIEAVADNPSILAVVIDAPLLLEAGMDALCDRLIFIDADAATRRERVRDRGWDEGELARREATQWPLAKKRRLAHRVIASDGMLKERLSAFLSAFNNQ